MALREKWLICRAILSTLRTKSGGSLELVPPWIPWHIRDEAQQKSFGMVLHYAPLEIIEALDASTWGVGGHPSAVYCEDAGEPVSLTWALWYRAFENPDDYYSVVKVNVEPFYFAYGGSPLDDLTKEQYKTVRDAFKPVLKYLLENFETGLLSRAVFAKLSSIFGGRKAFKSFVEENHDNFLSLDSSYESETAMKLGQSLSHLVKRRLDYAVLFSDHAECIHNKRRKEFYEEQCIRFDAAATILTRAVSGNANHVVRVARDIFEQGVTARGGQAPDRRTNRRLISAAIVAGSSTDTSFNDATQSALRLQVECSRNRSPNSDTQQSLLDGTKFLTGVDVPTVGDGNIVKRSTDIIVSALMQKETEAQQRHWSIEEVELLVKLEQKLHKCPNRFDLIALKIPGKF